MPISCHLRDCKALLVTYWCKKRYNKYRDLYLLPLPLYLYLYQFIVPHCGLDTYRPSSFFWSLVRRSGTRYLTSLEIRLWQFETISEKAILYSLYQCDQHVTYFFSNRMRCMNLRFTLSYSLIKNWPVSVCEMAAAVEYADWTRSVACRAWAHWRLANRQHSARNCRLVTAPALCAIKNKIKLYNTIQYSFIAVADRPLRKWHTQWHVGIR